MSHRSRSRVRALLAVPSAAVLVFGATELLASPPAASRAPDCATYCDWNMAKCEANPSYGYCTWCGCALALES